MQDSSESGILDWITDHPVQAGLRILFLVMQLGLNTLFFFSLFWGPFNIAYHHSFFLGFFLGLGFMVVWFRQQAAVILEEHKPAKHFRWFGLIVPALVIVIGGAYFVQAWTLGAFSPVANSYTEAFDGLWNLMDQHYVFFEKKDINWDSVYKDYQPRISTAESDQDFLEVVDEVLNLIPDGHTGLISPNLTYPELSVFGYTGLFQEDILVTRVGLTAELAGIEVGDKLVEIDGKSIPEAVRFWREIIPPSSTTQHYQKTLHLYLLSAADDSLSVKFEKPDGTVTTADLERVPDALNTQIQEPVISSQQLSSGVGVIRINNFDLSNGLMMIRAFDSALNKFHDAPGIIIDVRNNGGGFSVLADLIAGRFFSDPIVYGEEFYCSRLPQHFWRKSMKYRVIPRGKIYNGPVALITNPFTFSSADTFVAAMTNQDRAVVVGRKTAGATGNPITVQLPGGGRARFSTGDFLLPSGISLEGTGFEPDIPVSWTREDLILGNDPDLDAAEDYLLSAAR